jgi:methyl-accepting chemotaxis protein
MDEITQQNAALAEQASAASVSMTEQSANMTQLLAFFKAGLQTPVSASVVQQTSSIEQVVVSRPAAKNVATVQAEDNEFTASADDDEWEDF